MATHKGRKAAATFSIVIILAFIAILAFALPTNEVYAAKPSNFLTARTTGTLNGTLLKKADGSVTFNGTEIASAQENLSQMYVFLQGAGGAGGFEDDTFHSCNVIGAGGAGAFAVVLIKFKQNPDGKGESYPILISSGVGGTHGKMEHISLYPLKHELIPGTQPVDSVISIEGIGSIAARAGQNAETDPSANRTAGGVVETIALVDDFESYMELTMARKGCEGGSKDPELPGEASLSFTVGMYKNGGWLTTKHFVHKIGGVNISGGASPYSKGGDGAHADIVTPEFCTFPQDAPSYGAGGGGARPTFLLGNCTDEQRNLIKSGGRGGNGFIEIWG